jgi:hypothetical protein
MYINIILCMRIIECVQESVYNERRNRGAMCKKKERRQESHRHRPVSYAEFKSEIESDYPAQIAGMESKNRLF